MDELSKSHAFEKRPSSPVTGGLNLGRLSAWSESVPTGHRHLAILASMVVLSVFGIGGTWAATAKLGGALITGGRVLAEGKNHVIQHLEGGIIQEILAQEGSHVKVGQTLLRLDETATKSQLDRTLVDRAIYAIELARWRAEKQGSVDSFSVDEEDIAPVNKSPRVVEALESQIAEFQSSKLSRQQQLLILDGKISNEKEDIKYLKKLLTAYSSQKESLRKEEKSYNELLDQGLARQSQVLNLQRQLTQIDAQVANAEATIQKSNHNIQAFFDQKGGVMSKHIEDLNAKITSTQKSLNQSEDYITRLTDILSRSNVVSTVDGTIISFPYKSLGSIIKPGDQVAAILPDASALMIESAILPKDITKVFIGQDVEISFPSDQSNVIPALHGNVKYISADSLKNNDNGENYYLTYISMGNDRGGRNILPGNEAEVFFKTESKTLLQYIADPVTRFALKVYQE